MGLKSGIINSLAGLAGGVGNAISGVRETWKGSVEKREVRQAQAQANALNQYTAEFIKPENWFDSLMNGLNRTPRPVIANGTIGLFIYAFINPESFGETMEVLEKVPPEMWWLLSSVVVFYFGARELKYNRDHKQTIHKLNNRPQENATAEAVGDDAFDGIDNDAEEELTNLQKFQRRNARNRE